MFNSIENPLAEGDSYEIVTPDGAMAVRGTQFRVAVGVSPDGNARETRVSVLEGTVHVQLNNHAQDQTSLTAGQEAIIEGIGSKTMPVISRRQVRPLIWTQCRNT